MNTRSVRAAAAAAVGLLSLALIAGAPLAEEVSQPGSETIRIDGSWRGAKLRCRKEEGKAVRCGKPEPFEVVFNEDGTGSSADERFPGAFTYRWLSPTEIVIVPDDGSDELKLFQLELAEGFLTFQAYIHLPSENPDLPAEVNYIHYIFDVSQSE